MLASSSTSLIFLGKVNSEAKGAFVLEVSMSFLLWAGRRGTVSGEMEGMMTSRNTLKRQIRSRLNKTGESYSAARQHFQVAKDSLMNTKDFENSSTLVAQHLQSDLWPEWVVEHLWLNEFLPKAEAETRNRGDLKCDHLHMLLAYLRLPSPVSDWFVQLRVDTELWKEDVLVTLGINSGGSFFQTFLAYGSRLNRARKSGDPVAELPLEGISQEAKGMLELARSEADFDGTPIDERHFLVSAINWCQHSDPTLEELRKLTGRQQ